jgi:serine/threonine protein kinase
MLQVGQILEHRYQLVRQLGHLPSRQTWLAIDLAAGDCHTPDAQTLERQRVEVLSEQMDDAPCQEQQQSVALLSEFVDHIPDDRQIDSLVQPSNDPTQELHWVDSDPTEMGSSPGEEQEDSAPAHTDVVVDSCIDPAIAPSKYVVLKLLPFGGQVQWEELKLLEREAQVLKHLKHDRIPQYIDYFSVDDRILWFVLVQQYIPGASLKELLAQGQRFTETEVRQIAAEVLQILIYLHELSPPVIHRDIKPSNLIRGIDHRIYLVDFGAVQDRAAIEGSTFTVVGTYGYAPMEQFGGRTIAASDLYALGATLIHLLTGTAPADLPHKELRIQFADRVSLNPALVQWIQKLSEPCVEHRFQTARAALRELQAELTTTLVSTRPTSSRKLNTSGSGLSAAVSIPDEIQGWNWGALFFPWFWPFTNGLWYLGLLCWAAGGGAFFIALYLGAKGNAWAWKSKRWRSVQQFQAHQRGWAIAGIVLGIPISFSIWSNLITEIIKVLEAMVSF